MWRFELTIRQLDLGKVLSLGVYAASVIVLSTVSVWCAAMVGGATLAMIDRAIIDGSGQPDRQSVPDEASAGAPPEAPGQHRAQLVPQPVPPASKAATQIHLASAQRLPINTPEEDPAAAYHHGSEDTYRTFCVRLCDGYFWPVSFSTTPDRFAQDQQACASSCNSPAKLFVHKMPGGGPSTMTSLDGIPYAALKTAFLFRTSYDQQCKCQAQPWEQQTLDRHRLYAAVEAARKGNPMAQAEVRELAAKLQVVKKQEAKALAIASERSDQELAALSKSAAARSVAAEIAANHRRTSDERALRLAETRQQFGAPMGLGAIQEAPTKSGWIPASGTARNWKDKVFSGN